MSDTVMSARHRPRGAVAVSVLLVALLALAGCGGSGGTTDTAARDQGAEDAALSARLPAEVADAGSIRIATSLASPPEYFTTNANEPTGFLVDVLNAAGARLGVTIDFAVTPYSGLGPALDAERVDAAMAFSVNPDNLQKYDIIPVFDAIQGFLAKKGGVPAARDAASLCGKKIALAIGDLSSEAMAAEARSSCAALGAPEPTVDGYPAAAAAQTALRSGQVDLQMLNSMRGQYIASQEPAFETFVVDELAQRVGTRQLGIALRKGDPALGEALTAAIQSVRDDGTYETILAKYRIDAAAVIPTGPMTLAVR
ncbi:transporter substrate-binding domain-containing protein [Pseudonocardia pini]|uniref:transporter substrate-binding domain-containing protein n=1 Tax=Pseudonocardia pini TaxID=2758030 RepID=UPI0015EFFD88|nr:transporter substrate-binding domain-containing protein [Pseudonocardia pini]